MTTCGTHLGYDPCSAKLSDRPNQPPPAFASARDSGSPSPVEFDVGPRSRPASGGTDVYRSSMADSSGGLSFLMNSDSVSSLSCCFQDCSHTLCIRAL